MNTYEVLVKCLRVAKRIETLAEMSGVSKSTLHLIIKGRGKYKGSLITQFRLEECMNKYEKEIKEILKKRESLS